MRSGISRLTVAVQAAVIHVNVYTASCQEENLFLYNVASRSRFNETVLLLPIVQQVASCRILGGVYLYLSSTKLEANQFGTNVIEVRKLAS
jgi:hypothetical protein